MSLTPSVDGLLTFILSVFKIGVNEVRAGDGRSGKAIAGAGAAVISYFNFPLSHVRHGRQR